MKKGNKPTLTPKEIFAEYERGRAYKSRLGPLGLYEQNRRNERFYVGDQWHGAKCGGERPLVRHNVIKRIGEYKMAVIGADPIDVNFHAEGVPHTVGMREQVLQLRRAAATDPTQAYEQIKQLPESLTVDLVMSAMSDYFRTTAERLRFESVRSRILRDAYIAGSSYLYTYWDPDIVTGLYADKSGTMPIRGDVAVEVLDVENVYFGDPHREDIQTQPYILIASRKPLSAVTALQARYGQKDATVTPDEEYRATAPDRAQTDSGDEPQVTVLTKLYKQRGEDGETHVMAVQVCRGVTVRKPWDIGVRLYPLCGFVWEPRKGCAYGDSEITYLIPNQIAINRMITASVWAVMMMGIPITVVNGDVVSEPVTNDPGQVLRVYGSADDVQSAVRYVDPPSFSPKFDDNIASLIQNTLSQAGASDAALGDVRPDNTSAIIAVREAATLPMQRIRTRFFEFVEDFARVLSEFWVSCYGKRLLKVEDEGGVWYMPFDGEVYRRLLISATVDVGASGLWSEAQSIATLDNLLKAQIISPVQYLERLPKGSVPNLNGLIRQLRTPETVGEEESAEETSLIDSLPAAYKQRFEALSPEQQQAIWQKVHAAQGQGT